MAVRQLQVVTPLWITNYQIVLFAKPALSGYKHCPINENNSLRIASNAV